MKDFGNIIYRTETKAYVIRNNTYTVPHPDDETVSAEIHAEFDALYAEVDAYAKVNPDKVTEELPPTPYEPTPEDIEAMNIAKANSLITAKMKSNVVQTLSFSSDEYQLLAKANMFEEWTVGHTYEAGYKIQFEGIVYEVKQKVTALEHQKPGSIGMEAIYSPLCTNPETGETPDGTQENPYSFIYSMSVKKGCFYKHEDHIYEALMNVETCVWYPNATGVETIWKLIE